MNKNQLVSIVMPVYNAGDFLSEAIASIISQTYKNWELIAIDDASSDKSLLTLKKFAKKDKRIKVVKSFQRLGVSGAANLALSITQGNLIARMDADDIAFPARLEKQVKFLENNPKFVAVGGQCDIVNKEGIKVGEKKFPLGNFLIKKMIFVNIPVQQPAMMVNKKLLPVDFLWYDRHADTGEEVELLFKLFRLGKVANLSDKVLKYRIHGRNTSLINPKRTFFMTLKTRILAIFKYGYRPSLVGVIETLFQSLAVLILPNSFIYPLYAWVRGINSGTGSQAGLKPELA